MKTKAFMLTSAIAALILSGCTIGPNSNSGSEADGLHDHRVHVGIIDGAVNLKLDAFHCLDIEQVSDEGWEGGHGTAVAAIVLGVGDGVCRNSGDLLVTSYPVLDDENSGAQPDEIADAIDQAVTDGVDLLNISVDVFSDSPRMRESVERAVEAGVVIVAAAGNRAGLGAGYPAAYESVISVGALGSEGELAPFSAARGLDLAAPGVDVQTIDREGNPVSVSGTSVSAAAIAHLCIELIRSNRLEHSELLKALNTYRWESP
jgi:subtilisin family serine protease